MELFVIMTVAANNSRGVEQATLKWTVTVDQFATRENVFDHIYSKLPERLRNNGATVLFYSAEPNRLAGSGGMS
jgi:hypothetical protein